MAKLTFTILLINIFFLQSSFAQERTRYAGDTSLYFQIRQTILKMSDSIRKDPTKSDLYFRRAELLFDIEEWKQSEKDYTKAIYIDTSKFLYYYKRAAVRDRLYELSAAYEDYNKSIELNPVYEWAYLDRGLILKKLKLYKDADDNFRYALKLKPNWGFALFCIGSNCEDLNRADSAIYYYTQSIYYDSSQYKPYNNLGYIYLKQKKFDVAIELFDKALKNWSGYSLALTNRSEAKYAKGDKAGACADLLQAINLGRKDKIPVYRQYCE